MPKTTFLAALVVLGAPLAAFAGATGLSVIPDCAIPENIEDESDLALKESDYPTLDRTTFLFVDDATTEDDEKRGVWEETNAAKIQATNPTLAAVLRDTLQTEECVGVVNNELRTFYEADLFRAPEV